MFDVILSPFNYFYYLVPFLNVLPFRSFQKKVPGSVGKPAGNDVPQIPGTVRTKTNSYNSAAPNDAELYARRAGKQIAASGAQPSGLTNPLASANDYLLALSRRQGNQPQAQSQALAQAATSMPQTGQPNSSIPQSFLQNVPGTLGAATHSQGFLPSQQAAILQHGLRASQGMPGVSGQPHGPSSGNGVDGSQPNLGNSRQEVLAAVMALANSAGITPEQLKSLTPDQRSALINQTSLSMGGVNVQGLLGLNRVNANANPGHNGSADLPSGSAAGNIGNWMGQMGNGRAPSRVPMFPNNTVNQAMAQDKVKKLQQSRQPPLQQGVAHSSATAAAIAAIHGQRPPHHNQSIPGLTPAQVAAILSGKSGAEKQAALEVLQSRVEMSARGNVGSQMGPGTAGSGAAGAGTNSQLPSQGTTSPADAEVWAKLEELQTNYKFSLQRLRPVIRRLQLQRPPQKQEQFMKHLNDCFNILNIKRTQQIPPRLTLQLLIRAEQFMQQVVDVYSRYLKDMVKSSDADPEKRAEMLRQINACAPPKNSASTNPATAGVLNPGLGAHVGGQPVSQGVARPQIEPGSGVDAQLNVSQQRQYQQLQQSQAGQGLSANNLHAMQFLKQASQAGQFQGLQQQQHRSGQMGNGAVPDNVKASLKDANTKANVQRGADTQRDVRGGETRVGGAPGSGAVDGRAAAQAHVGAQVQAQLQAQAQAQVGRMGNGVGVAVTPNTVPETSLNPAFTNIRQNQLQHSQPLPPTAIQKTVQHPRGHSLNANGRSAALNVPRPASGTPASALLGGLQKAHLYANGAPDNTGNRGATSVGVAGANSVPPTVNGPAVQKPRPPLTLEQRFSSLESSVRDAVEYTQRLESYVDNEAKKARSERIQNTLAALRNNVGASGAAFDKHGVKRQFGLVDVDNFDSKGVISSKTVFECSGEGGLRLAKKPKNEVADVKTLREAVEADCRAAKERNPLLMIRVTEEFGQPVVTCLLNIPEIRLPKLVLRVQRGYPRKGGATYGFERPPMGWVGVLDDIRTRFKQALASAPAASVGVAAFLDAWAREADAVINGSHLSDNR